MSELVLPAGYRVTRHATLDSTSDEAKRRAEAGAPGGLIVWADVQEAGRGRRGRVWRSPPGGLYFSVLIRPDCTAQTGAQLSFLTAVALGAALEPHLGDGGPLTFKWPNDLLLNGRKLSGILLETAGGGGGDNLKWLVIGVGVNLTSSPANVDYPVTSLTEDGGAKAGPGQVLAAFMAAFEALHGVWKRDGFGPVRQAWLERAHGLGRELRVRAGAEEVVGIFRDLDARGALVLETKNGTRGIFAGDVYYAPEG